jgi:hypothetical protein
LYRVWTSGASVQVRFPIEGREVTDVSGPASFLRQSGRFSGRANSISARAMEDPFRPMTLLGNRMAREADAERGGVPALIEASSASSRQ